jgi:hypothetical protein
MTFHNQFVLRYDQIFASKPDIFHLKSFLTIPRSRPLRLPSSSASL